MEERLAERALALGDALRGALREIKSPRVAAVRGRGLLCAMVRARRRARARGSGSGRARHRPARSECSLP